MLHLSASIRKELERFVDGTAKLHVGNTAEAKRLKTSN